MPQTPTPNQGHALAQYANDLATICEQLAYIVGANNPDAVQSMLRNGGTK